MLLASQLTSLVDIETPTPSNTNGSVTESWGSVETNVPAEVIARESMTTKQAAGVQAQTTHLLRLRYRTDINSKCRFKIGSRVLNIVGPPRRVPEARPVELVMECIEVE